MKKTIMILLPILALVGIIFIGEGTAQNPPLKVSLVLNKSTYNSGEKIEAVLSLGKQSGGNVITRKGFSGKPFHLFLVFTDPDGKVITSNQLADTGMPDPPPPMVNWTPTGESVQVEPVETLSGPLTPNWVWTVTIPNVHDYYTLSKAGKWSVRAMIPMRTYFPPIDFPGPPVDYSRLDRVDFKDHLESNIASFAILSPTTAKGIINVTAEIHTVGSGNHPGSTKAPLGELNVVAFDMSASCVAQYDPPYGVTWQNYSDIWRSCPHEYYGQTDQDGKVALGLPAGDYIIIGQYDPDKNPISGDEIYIGHGITGLGPGGTRNEYLQVLVKGDGKKVPAKYTTKTGSELLIIEPEYIEWDGIQELYPFVFQSVGDWGVTTSVSPPEGFVADYNSLSTEVISEVRALQFIITDVGSKWVSTDVTYQLSHNKKKETVKSRVGIKLSEKLAKEKGLSKFGHEAKGKK